MFPVSGGSYVMWSMQRGAGILRSMLDFIRHWRRSLGNGVVTLLAATWLSVLAGLCQTAIAGEPDCPHCPEPAVADCGAMAKGPCMDTEPAVPQELSVPARLSDTDEAPPAAGPAFAPPRRVTALADVPAHDPPHPSIPLYLSFCRFTE